MVWKWRCFEHIFKKEQWPKKLMNCKGVCRTAPATPPPGLFKNFIHRPNHIILHISHEPHIISYLALSSRNVKNALFWLMNHPATSYLALTTWYSLSRPNHLILHVSIVSSITPNTWVFENGYLGKVFSSVSLKRSHICIMCQPWSGDLPSNPAIMIMPYLWPLSLWDRH